MHAEPRTVEEIRAEIAGERAQLEDALKELRRGLDAKRKPGSALVALLVLALATPLTLRVVRRFRDR